MKENDRVTLQRYIKVDKEDQLLHIVLKEILGLNDIGRVLESNVDLKSAFGLTKEVNLIQFFPDTERECRFIVPTYFFKKIKQ